ncbi:MAG: radical SAM protein [Proteobacteria bacterium]|nr:radical SAM protein [Pseudomonadota bacterium]
MNLNQIQEKIKDSRLFRKRRLQSRIPLEFPMVLNVELTNRCTENCIWCPRDSMDRTQGFMEVTLFKKIIDEASLYPKLRKLFVHWMGEPLLHPDFLECIKYASSKKVAEMILIATNGVLLTEKIMKGLIETKVDELYISIDAASSGRYEQLKHTKHFENIKHNIEHAVALKKQLKVKLPFIRVKFLETDLNADQIEAFKQQWRKNADSVFIEKDLSIWDGKSQKVNANIKGMKSYLKNYGELESRYPCDRIWYLLAVQWNGKVSPCVCDWNGENAVGDSNIQTLREIWYGNELKNYRYHHVNHAYDRLPLCDACDRWGTRHMGDWLMKHKEKALSVPDGR